MDLIKIATDLFISKLGGDGDGISSDLVMSSLQNLLPMNDGDLDIGALVSLFTSNSGALATLASSWLGDGGNDNLDISSVLSLFGDSKVSQFAENVGLNSEQAASGLSDMIPELIDKGSEGGNVMANVGSKLASDFLGKLF
jgi:uncharacterized protein YidB (DUF937 family)